MRLKASTATSLEPGPPTAIIPNTLNFCGDFVSIVKFDSFRILSFIILSSSVPITTIGFTLDSNLTSTEHVGKSAYYSIKALRHIRLVLTCDMARVVAASLTQTYLDFANSLLSELLHGSNINKLQRVQNCLARVVLQDHYNSVTSVLSELHWLPVNKRIKFKI